MAGAFRLGQVGVIDLARERRGPNLFDYQVELVGEILAASSSAGNYLVSLPTGAGKTRTAMYAAVRYLINGGTGRWLWLAPTIELIEQAASTFVSLWDGSSSAPDVRVAVRMPVDDAFLWLTTPQAINSTAWPLGKFDVVVFDEAHQLGAPTFRAAVERVKSTDTTLIGLSATPGRSNDRETEFLVDYFGGNLLTSPKLGRSPVEELQSRGVLSRLAFKQIGRDSSQWTPEQRLRALALLCRKLASRGRRSLVFTASVADSVALAIYLKSEGVAAEHVDGRLSEATRLRRIARFADGSTSVLLNQRLLATGYDCPAVTDVVLGARVGSPVLFEQIVGRAARGPLTGGSTVARVWEFDDHRAIHGLPQSYYRYRDFEWNG